MINLEGAVSNQIIKCIIYYNDGNRYKAEQKLKEIIEEKVRCGINMITYRTNLYNLEAIFSDGEEWITLNANNNARGYRWRKAYVDYDISKEIITCLITPCGDLYKWEDYKKY